MRNGNLVDLTLDVIAYTFYNIHRSVAATGTADRHGQIGAILRFEDRSPVDKKLADVLDHCIDKIVLLQKFCDWFVLAG